jgi:hypothetical protein
MTNLLILLILICVASLNVGFIFISAELIVCVSLLLLFYVFFLRFGSLVSGYFFGRIEYIYIFFFELISVNLSLVEFLLAFLNKLYRFQYKIFSVLENRIFFLKVLKFGHLIDNKIFFRVLVNLLYGFFSFFLAHEVKFLGNNANMDLNALLYVKFYHLQSFVNDKI